MTINLEPTKDEYAELERAADEKGVRPTVVGTDMLDAYKRGEFSLSGVREYLDRQKEARAHWFASVDDDLEQRAFGDNNQTARSRLYKQLGPVEYAEREKAWGATGFRKGKSPNDADPAGKAEDATKNPWRAKDFRTNKDAQQKAAGIISRLGTATAANLARSAGVTLDGRPLKVA